MFCLFYDIWISLSSIQEQSIEMKTAVNICSSFSEQSVFLKKIDKWKIENSFVFILKLSQMYVDRKRNVLNMQPR